MLINSMNFVAFMLVVTGIFFLTFSRFRWILLLVASFLFYSLFKPTHLVILAGSILVDYFLAIYIDKTQQPHHRKFLMWLGILNNIGLLILFKFSLYINTGLHTLLKKIHIDLHYPRMAWLVPVGISYYTFKKMAYLIDVYRQKYKPEPQLGKFALFVSFFPSIMAGPIDRGDQFLPQLAHGLNSSGKDITDGLKMILWGFFKKLVIADNLAVVVNTVYNSPRNFEGPQFLIATLFFSFQIFCDFSGYTDIAIGTARIFGIKLMKNFDRPYAATSISDFWRRWHISLSLWLRDYLFLPIAYRIDGKIKNHRFLKMRPEVFAYMVATCCTMLLCGLWHGSQWTFVVWGGLHGVVLCFAFVTKKIRRRIRKKLNINSHWYIYKHFQITITFLIVSFLWIFFRARNINDAYYIISHLFTGTPQFAADAYSFLVKLNMVTLAAFIPSQDLGATNFSIIVALLSISIMTWVHKLQKNNDSEFDFLQGKMLWMRWALIYFLMFWILFFGKFDEVKFIYLQF